MLYIVKNDFLMMPSITEKKHEKSLFFDYHGHENPRSFDYHGNGFS